MRLVLLRRPSAGMSRSPGDPSSGRAKHQQAQLIQVPWLVSLSGQKRIPFKEEIKPMSCLLVRWLCSEWKREIIPSKGVFFISQETEVQYELTMGAFCSSWQHGCGLFVIMSPYESAIQSDASYTGNSVIFPFFPPTDLDHWHREIQHYKKINSV